LEWGQFQKQVILILQEVARMSRFAS
jgi:hypothetical protein